MAEIILLMVEADVWPEFAGFLDARIPTISISSPVKVYSQYSRPKRKQNPFHSFAPRPPPCCCETFCFSQANIKVLVPLGKRLSLLPIDSNNCSLTLPPSSNVCSGKGIAVDGGQAMLK
jgi:hypothetical protein